MRDDLISRKKAYEVLMEYYHHKTEMQHKALREALDRVPSATQTNDSNTLNALDCVNRQAAIDEVCKMMYECFGADEEELDAIEVTLHELPSAEPGWIPVTERLPKPNEREEDGVERYYLIQNEFKDMMVAAYRENNSGHTWWEQMYAYKPSECKVIAWMPLPTPWKGENDG